MITEYLRMDMRLMTSGLGHHRLLLCAVQCAWYELIIIVIIIIIKGHL